MRRGRVEGFWTRCVAAVLAGACLHGSASAAVVAPGSGLEACLETLREGDAAARRDVLAQLAALVLGRSGPEARTGLRHLLLALEDPSLEVRGEAARLLPLVGHGNTAVEALTEAFEDHVDRQRRFLRAVERAREGNDASFAPPILGLEEGADLASFPAYGESLLHALETLPDDRTVKVVTRFLARPADQHGQALLVAAARSAVALGSRESVGALAACIEELRRDVQREAARNKARYKKGNEENPSRFGHLRGLGAVRGAYEPVGETTLHALENVLLESLPRLSIERPADPAAVDLVRWIADHDDALPVRFGRIEDDSLTHS